MPLDTTKTKKEFVLSLVQNVLSDILKDVEKMPEEWDGIELRMLVRDRFAAVVFKNSGSKKRVAAYNNTVLVENL